METILYSHIVFVGGMAIGENSHDERGLTV